MTDATVKQDRWYRLAADLAAVGIEAKVDRRPYSQIEYGRMVHGVSSSIVIQVSGRGTVEVRDKHGRGGKWYGFVTDLCDPEGIVKETTVRWAQKRPETVQTVVRYYRKLSA